MSQVRPRPPRLRWSWLRRAVQAAMLALFAAPLIVAGWGLFAGWAQGEDPLATPAQLPFFGSLSSTSVAGFSLIDPYAALQLVAASKLFELDWLLAALPVLIVYGLVRGRVFCGWVCPVNLLLEIIDALRRKLHIKVRETALPRHAKLWIAAGVLLLSAATSVPVFEILSPISAVNKGILFGATTGAWVLLAIVAAELFWGRRPWCRSLCPLGGFYEALGRLGQLNVKIDQPACIHCDACKQACLCDPTILDPVIDGRDQLVRAGDCMACGACIDACPTRALSFRLGRIPQARLPLAEEPAASQDQQDQGT